jgi:2-polyprenyl-3-methyl-5-hydroxy-6-metoxy-1,4-benzoquinol methylase
MIEPGLREAEIRPDDLMVEQAAAYERDVKRLLASKRSFVPVSCPACASSAAARIMDKFELHYLQCLDCRMVYLSPRPGPALLSDYYNNSENYEYWNKHIFPASEDARREKIFRPRAERVVDFCSRFDVPLGTLIDVGAGFGTFCEEIRAAGFERVIAIEPTPDLAQTCRDKGLEVIEQPVEEIRSGLAAEVVTAFEVIEHLFDPGAFVQACRRFLAPGGLLVLTCPNFEGFDIQVLRELSTAVDLEHLNYFTPASLCHLVERFGFRLVEVSTPGKLDAELVRKAVLRGNLDLEAQPFLQTVLVDRWDELGEAFQQFLAASKLSSHLWLVARVS